MPAVAQLRTAQDVLNWYNEQNECCFELYRFAAVPKNRQALYYGKDKEDGLQKLQSELSHIQSDDCENYVLVIGTLKGAKDKTFEAQFSKVFVINEKPFGVMAGMPGVYGINKQQQDINNEILNEIRALRAERLQEMEEEEEEPEEEPASPQSILAGMMQTPQVQQMLIAMLGNLVSSFSAPKVQHVSGTHTETDIEKIVQTLFSKGVTPDDLSKLAAMPESQISMLLSMLRK